MTGFNASDIAKLNLTDDDAVAAAGRQVWTSAQVGGSTLFTLFT